MAAVFFNLLAQSFDVGVDGARLEFAFAAPDSIEQIFAAKNMTRTICEMNEQLKLS